MESGEESSAGSLRSVENKGTVFVLHDGGSALLIEVGGIRLSSGHVDTIWLPGPGAIEDAPTYDRSEIISGINCFISPDTRNKGFGLAGVYIGTGGGSQGELRRLVAGQFAPAPGKDVVVESG